MSAFAAFSQPKHWSAGKMALIGPCQELLTLSLDPRAIAKPLNKSCGLFDRDLAAAAQCAETAYKSSIPLRKEKGALQVPSRASRPSLAHVEPVH